MSAIFGIVPQTSDRPYAPDLPLRMQRELAHYPKDQAGLWNSGPIALGSHSQWITPESIGATEPCHDPSLRLVIASDAILDNRSELFDLLGIPRQARKQMTDSKLILHAYRKWGADAPKFLIGDYAFAIWDEARQELFGARDLLGSRSLYYTKQTDYFAFCTVVHPLLALPGMTKELNESWLAEFLAIPVVLDAVDVQGTLYKHVQQLPPGHRFLLRDGRMTLEPYDSLTSPITPLRLRSNAEYEEAFREVFQTAVTSKLRTFRNVGICLSGGLDSASIAAFAAQPLREAGQTLHGYSYIPAADFEDWTSRRMAADERPFIRSITNHVGSIQAHYMDFQDRHSFEDLDELTALMEGPYKFIENSFWLKGILAQAEQEDIGILLNGGRGNYSISWGPAEDYYASLLRRWKWVALYKELKQYGSKMALGRKRLLSIIGRQAYPSLSRFPFFRQARHEPRPSLIHPDFARRTAVFERLAGHDVGLSEATGGDIEARLSEFGQYSVSNHIGTSQTRFSLRYNLQERDPTSDPRVIRFCLSLPIEQFVQNGEDRSLIRRATRGRLPDDVRLNQRVRGVQGADWVHRMRHVWPVFMREAAACAEDPRLAAYLDVDQIRRSVTVIGDAPSASRAFDPHARLLMLSVMMGRFLSRL
ncbi:asparagine synthase (glutamine-hydrolyzing) [Paenibacillus phyllosphaerae]|uniref:asparagine synthase (glutamine-hydrolyzing) n=1 Tax=Paenibacillus phyllosphaerae TaxID=274593 RepID=A0A7W5ATY9_9BACL|nr:asparagine synthase-related protein [Paenibacillus phyllosphaerae]MBB3108740.1 asparagine synthase (glutamine-hydrolyzing) [Paenibacillus phyllosphaerae]